MKNIESIRHLKDAAQTLRTLHPNFLKEIADSRCDKHAMKFGGDDRFSVFSAKVFLDCHTGYYGNSSCSTKGCVDNALASELLDGALNEHMILILDTMARLADEKAARLVIEAQAEIDSMTKLLESAKSQPAVEDVVGKDGGGVK